MAETFRWPDDECVIEVLDLERGTIHALQPLVAERSVPMERLRDPTVRPASVLERRGASEQLPAATLFQASAGLLPDEAASARPGETAARPAETAAVRTATRRSEGVRAYRKSVWTLLALVIVLGIESAWILQHVLRERSTEAPSRVGSLPSPAEGSLKVVFAFQVQVFENGRFLGTSDGNPITLSPGMHQLELVSDSPQYRSEHRAFIRSGHTTTLAPRW